MPIAVVGISHKTAPVEVRERFAFTRPEAVRELRALRERTGIEECVLLSTCNRTEIYFYPGGASRSAAARDLLADHAGPLTRPASAYLYTHTHDDAVRHLFRVAAGIESMVLGEAEIQGQVKEAYESALAAGGEPALVGTVLNRLFERSLAVGGRIRNETRVGEGSASVASVAVDLAGKVFGSLRNRNVLVMGAGTTAELVVEALAREGVRGVVVANRTYERAEELAGRLQGNAVRFEAMAGALRETDILVASTAAPHPLFTLERLREAFPDGPVHPLLVIDIAIPRDVDPRVGDEPNVFLYNVDDLRQMIDESIERRRGSLPRAEAIIDEEARSFRAWLASREVVPMIRDLRRRGAEVERSELDRTLAALEHLSAEDRERIEELSRRLVNKLLHDPTVRLKEGAANGRGADLIEAVRFLFDLDEPDDLEESDDLNEPEKGREDGTESEEPEKSADQASGGHTDAG